MSARSPYHLIAWVLVVIISHIYSTVSSPIILAEVRPEEGRIDRRGGTSERKERRGQCGHMTNSMNSWSPESVASVRTLPVISNVI